MTLSDTSLLIPASFIGGGLLLAFFRKYAQTAPLPPGPPGLPFFGNAFQLSQEWWLDFTRWREQYGDIVYVKLLGKDFIILNSHKAASDLLDRRAEIYSDRPPFIIASDMICNGLFLPICRYGDAWRRYRRVTNEGLTKSKVYTFAPYQIREAVYFTSALISSPELMLEHIKRATTSMIMSVTYGLPMITDEHSEHVKLIEDFGRQFLEVSFPGSHLVEFLPWMRYLPTWLAPWKKKALQGHKHYNERFISLCNGVKKRVQNGDDFPSFCAFLMADREESGLSEQELAWICGATIIGAAHTTTSALLWSIFAMVLHPECQTRVQQELDQVVGRSRMPTLDDVDSLPYLNAVVRETHRWRPITPLGNPHASIKDDWYEGYFIPKGSQCIANFWGLNHDTEVYGPDANLFNPDRFLDAQGNLLPPRPDTNKEGHISFGHGRRICPGRHVANSSVLITMACLLWAVNIKPSDKPQAHKPDPNKFQNNGLTLEPATFDCEFEPRCSGVMSIISKSKEDVLKV